MRLCILLPGAQAVRCRRPAARPPARTCTARAVGAALNVAADLNPSKRFRTCTRTAGPRPAAQQRLEGHGAPLATHGWLHGTLHRQGPRPQPSTHRRLGADRQVRHHGCEPGHFCSQLPLLPLPWLRTDQHSEEGVRERPREPSPMQKTHLSQRRERGWRFLSGARLEPQGPVLAFHGMHLGAILDRKVQAHRRRAC